MGCYPQGAVVQLANACVAGCREKRTQPSSLYHDTERLRQEVEGALVPGPRVFSAVVESKAIQVLNALPDGIHIICVEWIVLGLEISSDDEQVIGQCVEFI